MERTLYEKDSLTFVIGQIGALQTNKVAYVVAGDSVQMDWESVTTMSPFNKGLIMDAVLDQYMFFVPMRHIYTTDEWIDFIKSGYDTDIAFTLGTDTATYDIDCVGQHLNAGTVGKYLHRGYMQIWKNYFMAPNESSVPADTYLCSESDADIRSYGVKVCYLPRTWNTLINPIHTESTDYTVSSASDFTLFDLDLAKFKLKSERKRDFFATRYRDIMREMYGSMVNLDAEQRPELIAHNRQFLNSRAQYGADATTLGQHVSVSESVSGVRMPWKFFPEHGWIFCMQAVRFPSVHEYERNYLVHETTPTYETYAGDADYLSRMPPESLTMAEWISNGTLTGGGDVPFGNWLREEPNYVHNKYQSLTGYPFLSSVFASTAEAQYVSRGDYDDVFQSTQLEHWNTQSHVGMKVKSVVPPAVRSIFAGV